MRSHCHLTGSVRTRDQTLGGQSQHLMAATYRRYGNGRRGPWTTTNLLNWIPWPASGTIPAYYAVASSLPRSASRQGSRRRSTNSPELAVLKIISVEVVRHGTCTLTKNAIADLSCTSSTVVKVAIRTAKAEGLITVERTGRRNTVTILPNWKSWLGRYCDAPPDGPHG